MGFFSLGNPYLVRRSDYTISTSGHFPVVLPFAREVDDLFGKIMWLNSLVFTGILDKTLRKGK